MKFCPNCGSKLNDDRICKICNYNIEEIGADDRQYLDDLKRKIQEDSNEREKKTISLEEIKKYTMNYDGLYGILYGTSPITMGPIETYYLDYKNKTLKCVNMNVFGNKQKIKIYKIKDEVIDKTKKIIEENNMAAWSRLEKDYNSTRVSEICDMHIYIKDETFNIFSPTILSKEETKIFNDLKDYILNQMTEENLISEEEKTNEQFIYEQTLMG